MRINQSNRFRQETYNNNNKANKNGGPKYNFQNLTVQHFSTVRLLVHLLDHHRHPMEGIEYIMEQELYSYNAIIYTAKPLNKGHFGTYIN